MKPTWAGWPELLAVQNEDVESTSDCLYSGQWYRDYRDWRPEIYSTGLTWDVCTPMVSTSAEFAIIDTILTDDKDLWTPAGEENTIWTDVQYPD